MSWLLVHASQHGLIDSEESIDALDGTTYKVMRSARWLNLCFVPVSPTIWSAFKAIKQFKLTSSTFTTRNSSAMWLLLLPARRIPWVAHHWQSDIETPSSSKLVKFLVSDLSPNRAGDTAKTARIIATSPPYPVQCGTGESVCGQPRNHPARPGSLQIAPS